MLGIYRLEKDTLTLCVNKPGAARPTEFVSKPENETMLLVLRRAKK